MVDFGDLKFKGKDIHSTEIKGGIKRESITDSNLLNIFDKVDNNPKDGILDSQEINVFQQKVIEEAAKRGRDSKLSNREAEQYLASIDISGDSSNLFSFINKLSKESENIKNSQTLADGTIVTEYKDGTKEIIQNGSKIIQNGTTTKKYIQNEKGEYEIAEESFVDPKDGSETVTKFKKGKKTSSVKTYPNGTKEEITYNEDGTTPAKSVKSDSNGNIETITYDSKGLPTAKTTIKDKGQIEEEYTYKDGQALLKSKITGKGTEEEKETVYEYNSNGTTTETSVDKDNNKQILIKKGNDIIKESRTNADGSSYTKIVEEGKITETTIDKNGQKTIKIHETNGNTTTDTVIDKKGKTVNQITKQGENTLKTFIDTDNTKTETLVNASNKRLTQTYTDKKGRTRTVNYDGNGNTTGIVVQFGENAARIAKKFGCTKADLLAANGKSNGEDFEVGETIIIPKEIDADNRNLKNRKSAEEAIRAKQIDAQYRSMGLKNYSRSGEKFEYNGQTYTVIGTMNNRARLLVRDSKGKITVASHDNLILKDSYVQMTNAFDYGEKVTGKAKNKAGEIVNNGDYVRIGEKDKHGRSIVVDKNGKQWIMAHDGTLLKPEYVEASNVYDVMKDNLSTSSYNEDIKYAKVNGKIYYFTKDGKVLDKTKITKIQAEAIIKDLNDGADGSWYNFGTGLGTDEDKMIKANKAIVDPEVLKLINDYYSTEYGNDVKNGKYKSAYEAFLASEISNSEIYTMNADLVGNGAILDQARRDEILLTNLTTYGKKSENRNAALNAVTTRTDYDNLQTAAQEYNKINKIKGHFKDQDALQALLYYQTEGNAGEMDSANRNLTDASKNILTKEEIIRIKAEVGTYYVEEGNNKKAYNSFDKEVYTKMDELLPKGKKVADTASKADRMITGYGDFTNEQIADEAIRYLKIAVENYEDALEQMTGISAVNGGGTGAASIYHQNAEDAATKAFQLIKNDEILKIIKEKAPDEYEKLTKKIEFETNGNINFSNIMLESTSNKVELSQEEINKNNEVVELIKKNISVLEKSFKDSVDNEGIKMDLVNGLRQSMFLGTTRADVDNIYALAQSNLNKLSMAAEGKLVDSNGNSIPFEKAIEMLTGMNLQEINNTYLTHQAYGEAGLDLTLALVTMPAGGAGALKLVGTMGTVGKTINTVKTLSTITSAVGSGIAAGGTQYLADSIDMNTSISGNTMERRASAENKAMETGISAAVGSSIGGATEQISTKIGSTTGKVLTQAGGYTADLGSAAGITGGFHNGNWQEGFTENAIITSVGYILGVRTAVKMNGLNSKNLDDLLKMHKLNIQNKDLPNPLNNSNIESLKKLNFEEAKNYLDDRGFKVEIQDNKLVYSDNQGIHELRFDKNSGIVSNINDISTKLTDTEFKQIIDHMKKCDESEFNRIKQELIDGGLTDEQLKKLDEIKPKKTNNENNNEEEINNSSEEDIIEINNQEKVSPEEVLENILNNNKGALNEKDANFINKYIDTNINNIEELENIKKQLESRVGYQVQGIDNAQQTIKKIEARINNIKAKQAEFSNIKEAIESKISAKKGLSEQDIQMVNEFIKKCDTTEDLDNLLSLLKNKNIKKSSMLSNLIKITENKKNSLASQRLEINSQNSSHIETDPIDYSKKIEEFKTAEELEAYRNTLSAEEQVKFDEAYMDKVQENKPVNPTEKVDDIKPDVSLKSKLGHSLYAVYEKIIDGINNLKTIVDFTTIKNKIQTAFASTKDVMNDLLEKLHTKAKSINLDTRPRVKMNNSDEINNLIPDELVRVKGNNGKNIDSRYIQASQDAREFMNESILSGAYTRDLNSYIETINQMHVISAKGKNGNIDWYSSVGQGSLGVDAGVIRGKGSLRNNRVETAELSENIALRYGDSYRTSNSGSTVKLKGIPKEYLPQDFGTQHFYPDGMGLNHYYKEMHRTAQETLDLIANGATEKQFLAKIAEHYQYAANARPYSQINNSLFMNEINTLLKKAGMKTIPHGNLDTVAMHLQPETFKKYFIDEYYKNVL